MKRLLLSVLAMGLASCATPYQEGGWTGGVAASPMGGDLYRIEASLNRYSTRSMLQDYMLLRAAETATAHGAIGFVILGAEDATKTGTVVTPGHAETSAQVSAFGNNAYGTATTTYTPAQAYQMVMPGGIMLIRLVRDPSEGSYINAAQIETAIGPRVQRAR